jgi:serine phosphatase RsbU (regulator of sigma subunit)
LTEALNNEMKQFGQERLAKFLRDAAELSASEMLQVVRRGVGVYGDHSPLSDDMTLVAVKISGG